MNILRLWGRGLMPGFDLVLFSLAFVRTYYVLGTVLMLLAI
jgi:hypothetical protein